MLIFDTSIGEWREQTEADKKWASDVSNAVRRKSSSLYESVSDLAMNDGTVYAHLRMQEASGMSDLDTAKVLIRTLVKEKAIYLEHANHMASMSMVPIQPFNSLGGDKS